MAQSRYIQFFEGESWIKVSKMFGQWLKDNDKGHGIGWSEGEILEVNENTKLYCLDIPDHHSLKIDLFEEWAQSTDRLYGIEKDGKVVFPKDSNLVVVLQKTKEIVSSTMVKMKYARHI